MKYPFTPEVLDALPEPLAELFRQLEIDLLEEICSRLRIADNINEVSVEAIRALRSHGVSMAEIKKAVQKTVGIGQDELNKLLDDVVERNQRYYNELINIAKVTQPRTIVDNSVIDAIKAQTLEEFTNITQSMGFQVTQGARKVLLPFGKEYQWALDSAVLKIDSGAYSYSTAIPAAVKELADSGLKIVNYESGHADHVDVAVRRAVMTGIGQLCAQYTEQSAKRLGTQYYEISAHRGARDTGIKWQNHKSWQGRVYSVQTADKYPNIYEVCGLGLVDGLEGANCRHIRFPFIDGVSERTYTDEQLENIDPPPFEYQGKTYTAYEATQQQRKIERTMRKLKREQAAYKAAGLTEEATATGARMRRLSKEYTQFSKAANLPEQRDRMKVEYVDNQARQKADALIAARELERPIKQAIINKEYPTQINAEKQARHMPATARTGASVVTISAEELQRIVNSTAGTGKLLFNKNKLWKNQEIVYAGKTIGYTINKNGEIKEARSLKLHYSNTGIHAIPYSRWWTK